MNDLVSISGICFVSCPSKTEPPAKRHYRPRGERTRKEQQREAQARYYRSHRTEILKSAAAYYSRHKTEILRKQREARAKQIEVVLRTDDIVYIAGPMTGKPLLNFPAFYAFAGLIEHEFGSKVFNPARHPSGLSFDEYMRLDLQDLRNCTKAIFLNGWQKSKGALIEREFCRKNQIPMYSQRSLIQTLKKKIEQK